MLAKLTKDSIGKISCIHINRKNKFRPRIFSRYNYAIKKLKFTVFTLCFCITRPAYLNHKLFVKRGHSCYFKPRSSSTENWALSEDIFLVEYCLTAWKSQNPPIARFPKETADWQDLVNLAKNLVQTEMLFYESFQLRIDNYDTAKCRKWNVDSVEYL